MNYQNKIFFLIYGRFLKFSDRIQNLPIDFGLFKGEKIKVFLLPWSRAGLGTESVVCGTLWHIITLKHIAAHYYLEAEQG